MRSYSNITFKYLKKQKRRTILTILGIVLSVALITAIGTMLQSLKDAQIEYEKKTQGDCHFSYSKADKSLYDKINDHAVVEKIALSKDGGVISVNSNYKLVVTEYDKNAMGMLPLNLKEGSVPENEDEIIIEKWMAKYLPSNPDIGDTIKLSVNGRERIYVLKGFLENNFMAKRGDVAQAIVLNNRILEDGNFRLDVKLNSNVSIKSYINEFEKLGKENGFALNKRLLAVIGQSNDDIINRTLNIVAGFFIILVCIVTISVIYNSFHISVLERISQFGVLRSIGATKGQIRRIVFMEAGILSLISIPIGIGLGLLGLKIVLYFTGFNLYNLGSIEMSINPKILMLSAAIGLLSVFLSGFYPAYKASRVSPIEAITNQGSIVKEKIKAKKRGLIQRLLSVEHLMAYNNLKRNRKRFRITVFSMCISVVLFLVFTSFVDMVFNFKDQINETMNISLILYRGTYETDMKEFDDKDYSIIKNIDGIDAVYREYKESECVSLVPENKMNSYYLSCAADGAASKKVSIEKGSEKYNTVNSTVFVYKNEKLDKCQPYIIDGRVDEERLNKENGVILVQKTMFKDKKESKDVMDNMCNYKVGDEILIAANENEADKLKSPLKNNIKKVKVMAILNMCPFGNSLSDNKINILTTENVYNNIFNGTDKSNLQLLGFQIMNKEGVDSEELQANIIGAISNKYDDLKIEDIEGQLKQLKQFEMEFKVLLYAFIIVISLISSINIVNTVNTNLILRKREFSTLKAVGMTLKQIQNMVRFEGLMYGLTGCIYGIILSIPLSSFLYNQMGSIRGFSWNISIKNIIIASVATMFIGLASVSIPLKKINETSIVDGIRMED